MADKNYEALQQYLQKMKEEILNEVRFSSAQVSATVQDTTGVDAVLDELRYIYKQNQNVYEGVSSEVGGKIDALTGEMDEVKYSCKQLQSEYEGLSGEVVSGGEDNKKILDAIAAIPAPDGVDYNRIVDEVGDKLLDIVNNIKAAGPVTAEPVVDYDKIIGGTAEKVVESLPYPERVDYAKIEDSIAKAVAAAIDVDALANAVAAKIVVPAPVVEPAPAPEIDYERLADLVAAKLAAKEQSYDVILDDEGIEAIADKVAAKVGTVDNVDYDKVCLAAQAAQILPDPVDYDRIAEIVEDKIATETTFELIIDDEGISAIAKGVSEELKNTCGVCEAEPVAEEPVEEVVAESVEEPVEETSVEEAPVAEELAVTAVPHEHEYREIEGGELIDAETGLVIRLKRSFTAKMKQSDEKVKEYYSTLKNELVSYKRINSNVSWHGDRFNFGRDTVAKININGKTLCFYLALDPNDPEYKTTVYHQKDVGAQKAYENTPFLVKVKSDAAAKKALRLVGYLAEKLAAEKEESFQPVDYVSEYAYESTKQLFDEGFIKATKEKKVDFDF